MSKEAPSADPHHLRGCEAADERALRIVELLADKVGPRRPTGSSECRAAKLLCELLVELEVPAGLEPFRGYSSFGLPFGLIMATAAAPALLPARMRALRSGLALLAAAGLASEGSLTHTPLSDVLARRGSQNLVARSEPRGRAERTICLLGHLDTSRSGLLFDPRFVGWMGRWITLNCALVIGSALAEPLAGSSRSLRRALALGRAAVGAGLGLLLEREVRGEEVPGANDNASGCAVAAALAAELAAAPLASTRVVLCLTGCEEVGTLGVRAFLDAHETDGWLFLNFDNVGGGGTLRYLRREGVITLSIQDGFIPNLHWPTDTVANLDPDGVARALAAGREIVAAIDSGAADPGR